MKKNEVDLGAMLKELHTFLSGSQVIVDNPELRDGLEALGELPNEKVTVVHYQWKRITTGGKESYSFQEVQCLLEQHKPRFFKI